MKKNIAFAFLVFGGILGLTSKTLCLAEYH